MTSNMKSTDALQPVRSRLGRRIGFVLFSLFVAAILTEVSVRVLHIGSRVYFANRLEPGGQVPWVMVHENFPCYKPSTIFSEVYDPSGDKRGYFGPTGRVIYEINQNGFRGPPLPIERSPDTVRVLCLGDSFTFGEGVHYGDTYPARLDKLLAPCFPGKKVEVINAGTQAYSTVEEGVLYLERGQRFKPDIMTLGFVLNDAMTMQETAQGNDAITSDYAVSALARVSRVWDIIERSRASTRLQEKFFNDIRRSFESEAWDRCKIVLATLGQAARQNHCRFLVVIFPVFCGLEREYPFSDIHAKVVEACRVSGCECIDLLEVFRGSKSEDLWVHPTDQHPNEVAHRMAAERIAKTLCTPPPK
jgi:hypothetical protein